MKVGAFKVFNVRGLSTSYAAPERLSSKMFNDVVHARQAVQISKSADTYSMGITIVQMINHRHPWTQ